MQEDQELQPAKTQEELKKSQRETEAKLYGLFLLSMHGGTGHGKDGFLFDVLMMFFLGSAGALLFSTTLDERWKLVNGVGFLILFFGWLIGIIFQYIVRKSHSKRSVRLPTAIASWLLMSLISQLIVDHSPAAFVMMIVAWFSGIGFYFMAEMMYEESQKPSWLDDL